jgi:hypothetical protein
MSPRAKKLSGVVLAVIAAGWGCSTSTTQIGTQTNRNPAMSGSRPAPQPDNSNDNVSVSSAVEVLQITTINGTNAATDGGIIYVHPGSDVVSLTADIFNSGSAEGRTVEEFNWSDNSGTCSGSDAASCLDSTNFQVTDYGVNYYVPQNMTQNITITVSDSSLPGSADTIVLAPVADYVAPVTLAVSPEQYSCSDFNADCALAGQGRWIYINGTRFFSPYVSDAAWEPYNHGYWNWVDDNNYGWTWNSYDTWGWYTDHYGQWRHHGAYGWVWSPFDDAVYRPSTVTWFYDEGHVGWYPYYHDYAQSHVYWGVEYGFDDGFWGGYPTADAFGGFHTGFYHVGYRDFGASDVWGHRAVDIDAGDFYRGSFGNRSYGAWPGGADYNSSHIYMSNRGALINIGRIDTRSFGSSRMVFPHAMNPVPAQYRPVADPSARFGRPIPVGAVISRNNGREQVVQPTSNGRGISAAPMVRGNDGEVHALPPQTRQPAAPNPANPVYHRPAAPGESERPVFNPSHSTPQQPSNNGNGNRPGNNEPNGNNNHGTPSEPNGNNNHGTPSEPNGNNNHGTPSEPNGNNNHTSTPSTPNGNNNHTSTPSTPSGNNNHTSTPSTPSGNNNHTSTPSTPSGNNNHTSTPSTPSTPHTSTPVVTQPSTPHTSTPVVTQPSTPHTSTPVVTQPSTPHTSAPVPVVHNAPAPAPRPAPVVSKPTPKAEPAEEEEAPAAVKRKPGSVQNSSDSDVNSDQ